MESHDEPIPNKKKGKNQPNNLKSKNVKANPSEDGRTYITDLQNLVKAANYS